MNTANAIKAGAIGAASLNLVHESARHLLPNAPHVDLLAMKALGVYLLEPLGIEMNPKTLRRITLAGDLISNALYYAAAIGASKKVDSTAVWKRAWFWGLTAGATVVVMPSLMKRLG